MQHLYSNTEAADHNSHGTFSGYQDFPTGQMAARPLDQAWPIPSFCKYPEQTYKFLKFHIGHEVDPVGSANLQADNTTPPHALNASGLNGLSDVSNPDIQCLF